MARTDPASAANDAQTDPERFGIDPAALDRLYGQIERHIAEGRYPGAAVAMARHGEVVAARSFGHARLPDGDGAEVKATNDTLWLLYSQTKPVVSSAIWQLVERGQLRFHDRVVEYLPEFARHGKENVTLFHLLTHQAGFPHARAITPGLWEDHAALREAVCDFTLEWEPGARVVYHGAASHWVQATLIEAVTGRDYRDHVREAILAPIGLDDLRVGVPDDMHGRVAHIHDSQDGGFAPLADGQNTPAHWRAGIPGGGGYATASALATFYQMLLALGTLHGVRLLGPRTIQYATRNHTGERIDEGMNMPMHRGLGVHVRGTTASIRGLGSTASPSTFGHGGAGTSYSWADPETGVSFTYLTNGRAAEPWHSQRLDEIATLAHAAVTGL